LSARDALVPLYLRRINVSQATMADEGVGHHPDEFNTSLATFPQIVEKFHIYRWKIRRIV
jgi:hypothetical protein